MPKKKRKKRKTKKEGSEDLYIVLFRITVFVAVIVLIVYLKPIVQRFISKTFIRFEPSTARDIAVNSGAGKKDSGSEVLEVERSAPPALQGSFTELFSGVGWKNPLNSTVYQDFKTLTVSFPPAYQLEELKSVGLIDVIEKNEGSVTIGSRTFISEVREVAGQYEIYLHEVKNGERISVFPEPVLFSQYPGEIIFGSGVGSRMLLFYSAYESKALEISLDPVEIVNDYSSAFNARVTEEGKIEPMVFYKNNPSSGEEGAWWMFSVSDAPKLLRIRSGLVHDFTDELIGRLDSVSFVAAPAPEENAIYITSGERIFRLRDLGFKKSGRLAWESLRLNAWNGSVVRARFTKIQSGGNGGSIKYFLSNNGGRDWIETEAGEFVQFETEGGDFRWRAELRESRNQFTSPWIKTVRAEYYIIRE